MTMVPDSGAVTMLYRIRSPSRSTAPTVPTIGRSPSAVIWVGLNQGAWLNSVRRVPASESYSQPLTGAATGSTEMRVRPVPIKAAIWLATNCRPKLGPSSETTADCAGVSTSTSLEDGSGSGRAAAPTGVAGASLDPVSAGSPVEAGT